jgi:hypothetical protein
MSTRIPPVTRAIIMLDQSSGELREDEGALLGLDLWPETRSALSSSFAGELEATIVVPTQLEAGLVTDLSGWLAGLKVRVISPEPAFSSLTETMSGFVPDAGSTAFVAADRRLRGEAANAGMHPAPHVAVLPMMRRGEVPEAVRLVGPQEILRRLALHEDVIPMHFQPERDINWSMIALTASQSRISAVLQGVALQPLSYDPMTEDLFWVRIDSDSAEVREALAERDILYAESGQVLIALGPEESPQALVLHGAHGHTEMLIPSPELLRPALRESGDFAGIDPRTLSEDILEPVSSMPINPVILKYYRPSCRVVTSGYETDLNRYTGLAALDANGPIISRHSAHPHNKRTEDQLLADLKAIGYCAYRHTFTHAGQTHSNIIADLPGRGVFQIRPEIWRRYREILRNNPFPHPLPDLKQETDTDTLARFPEFAETMLEGISDVELRYRIEEIFALYPWYPWWKDLCLLTGIGADLVIVGCHLDSTAGFEPGYLAASDPAPGRDDNASGLAGVLSLARFLWSLRSRLTHTVRFCFFNAEETGLVGSKAYAAKMKSLGAPIRAVICLDMIGYNSDPNRIFEIHAGFTDPAIRDLSLPLVAPVANAAAAYSRLAPAQVYSGTSWNGAPDRSVFDGAINRSDHAAFHQQGYPAILVSEDFFANLASEPSADPNPNYHRAADTTIDLTYARDIVCAVAKAVMILAQ